MQQDQLIYWGLIVSTVIAMVLGVFITFFSRSFFEKRARLAEHRLGKGAVTFFVVTLRILGVLLTILSIHLMWNLLQIMPCALKDV